MELAMSALKAFAITAIPKHSNSDPITNRRIKLLKQLEQQLALAKDPMFIVKTQKWRKDEDGVKQLFEKQKRVRQWWLVDLMGNCFFVVRYGAKVIEIEKGKGAIAVGDITNLAAVIEAVIVAVRGGEFDALLGAVGRVGLKTAKKAA